METLHAGEDRQRRRGNMRKVACLAVAVTALTGCSHPTSGDHGVTTAPIATDVVTTSLDPDEAWDCIISQYPDTAAMGGAFDVCVAERSAQPPPPPPPASAKKVLILGYSTAGSLAHGIDLVHNPWMTLEHVINRPVQWGYGDCVTVMAGYESTFILAPGAHVYQKDRAPPACLGGTGRVVTRVTGDPLYNGNGVSYVTAWRHFDTLVTLHGQPTHVWWFVSDHKGAPATLAHVNHTHQQIRARWPNAVIVVNSVSDQIPQGMCNVLAQSAWPNSVAFKQHALSLAGTMPGPTITPMSPAHTSDGCHFNRDGLENGPYGQEVYDWWMALP